MRILVSGATPTVREWYAKRPDRLGVLLVPDAGFPKTFLESRSVPFAADNGCFSGLDAPAFLRLLASLIETNRPPLFVAAPDVVGDAASTLERFIVWEPVFRSLGLPVALVGQDGLLSSDVPWSDIDAYFIGGSTEWKTSRESERLCKEALGKGKHVHMGRVNTFQRICTAARWGCDTIDGTGFTWFPDIRIPKGVRWVDLALGGLFS